MTDYIKREDAMAEFREFVKRANENGETPTWNDAVSLIGSLPSAENHKADEQKIQSGDLISRADVLEGLKHSTAYLHDDIYTIVNRIPSAETTGALDDAIAKYVADGLMELPSADAVPHGRLIDADKLKSYIDCGHLRPPTEVCFSELDVCNMIDKAPTVSADAVHGEWVEIDNYYRLATCSHCHKVTMFEKWGEDVKPYDFCPNCGARMKGGDDE